MLPISICSTIANRLMSLLSTASSTVLSFSIDEASPSSFIFHSKTHFMASRRNTLPSCCIAGVWNALFGGVDATYVHGNPVCSSSGRLSFFTGVHRASIIELSSLSRMRAQVHFPLTASAFGNTLFPFISVITICLPTFFHFLFFTTSIFHLYTAISHFLTFDLSGTITK